MILFVVVYHILLSLVMFRHELSPNSCSLQQDRFDIVQHTHVPVYNKDNKSEGKTSQNKER